MIDETGTSFPAGRVSVCHFPVDDNTTPISSWKWNNTWTGTLLNFGYDHYLSRARALLRPHQIDDSGRRRIGLVVESFGYWDLRAAHKTKVQRLADATVPKNAAKDGPNIATLEPIAFRYLKSTKSYKLCIVWFDEKDFLPQQCYQFQYNGLPDYETAIFLRPFVGIDDLFDDGKNGVETVDFVTLPQRLAPLPFDGTDLPEKVIAAESNGSWGNPNANDAPYGPLGF